MFAVPDTKGHRRFINRELCNMWRNFKTTLTKEYITKKTKFGTPCSDYSDIDEAKWKEFVRKRLDPTFQMHMLQMIYTCVWLFSDIIHLYLT